MDAVEVFPMARKLLAVLLSPINLLFILAEAGIAPHIICQIHHFAALFRGIHIDKLLSAKNFPHRSVLLQVIEEDSRVPAI